jgi:hypothetical protein
MLATGRPDRQSGLNFTPDRACDERIGGAHERWVRAHLVDAVLTRISLGGFVGAPNTAAAAMTHSPVAMTRPAKASDDMITPLTSHARVSRFGQTRIPQTRYAQ